MSGDPLREWLTSKEYLPPFLRDFHDQKDAFKAVEEMAARSRANGNRYIEDVSWVAAQVYTIDIFLWWAAMHGWKLQRARKPVPFHDTAATIAASKERWNEQAAKALGLTPLKASQTPPASDGEVQRSEADRTQKTQRRKRMNPDLREKVARVIDPEAMRTLAEWEAKVLADASLSLQAYSREGIKALAADNFLGMNERRQAALTKADSILSLLPKWEGGWQPIESAPRDGTRVLAYCGTAYTPTAFETWWADDYYGEGWHLYSQGGEKQSGGVTIWFPTGWQPLPSPPGEDTGP